MTKKKRVYSPKTVEAFTLIGQLIKLNRKVKQMSESELADRIGVARATIQKIEKGMPQCEIGLVFEAATIVGVNLFHHDDDLIALYHQGIQGKIALLPQRIHKIATELSDDF